MLANPAVEPLQNYGWKVTPTGDGRAQVISFINKNDSSTIAPALQITIRGDTAVLSGMQPGPGQPAAVYANAGMPMIFGVTPTVTQLPADTTRPFVRGLYQSLLGRGAVSSEVDYWSDQMRRGFTQDQIRGFFMQTPEYQPRGFVTGLYRDLLGREPAPAEVTIWADRLRAGMTQAQVRQGFLDSDEYRAGLPTRPAQAAATATPVVAGLDAWRGRRALLAARFAVRRFRFA